jgi:K+-transporting ATPase ATPase C chain
MVFIMTIVLGIAYPAVVALIGVGVFPAQANGSLVRDADGRVRGSVLLAQAEFRPGRFRPRPSEANYDGTAGAASNLGPTSALLAARTAERKTARALENPGAAVPDELVYASGSGLDPNLSPEGARFQIPRIAAEIGAEETDIASIIDVFIEHPAFGFLGPERVNVLRLNRELDARYGADARTAR